MSSPTGRFALGMLIALAVLGAGAGAAPAMPGWSAHPDTSKVPVKTPLPKNMAPLPKAPVQSADLSKARKVAHVDLVIRHRVFANFVDVVKADLGAPFQVGDTDYKATIIQYVPDFTMDIESGRVYSRSDQPNNPAFRIAVTQKGAAMDTTWALLDMPPHFGRKSLLSFQVVRIDYTSGKPVLPRKPVAPAGGKGK